MEVNALACLPAGIKPRYAEFAFFIRLAPFGLLALVSEHVITAEFGLALACGLPVDYLRYRIGDVEREAVKRSGDPAAYVAAIARSAWIHRRELGKMSPARRLLGLQTPQHRIDRIAEEHGLDPKDFPQNADLPWEPLVT